MQVERALLHGGSRGLWGLGRLVLGLGGCRDGASAADGLVTRGNVPSSTEQPRETEINTVYARRVTGGERFIGGGSARVGLGSWWGNGLPSRRSVAGLRG